MTQVEKPSCNVLWLKRDLRIRDHAPLQAALQTHLPLVLLYVWEPATMAYPDWDLRHGQFVWQALQALNQSLRPYQAEVAQPYGHILDVLDWISHFYSIRGVYSHQETSLRVGYERDQAVKKYLLQNQVAWYEFQLNGVERGRRNRAGWDEAWKNFMKAPLQHPDLGALQSLPLPWPEKLQMPPHLAEALAQYPATYQPAGEKYAWQYFRSFLNHRAAHYNRHLSLPEQSRTSCSRLSPYLAWGNLSVRQVYQAYQQVLGESPYRFQLKSFRSRLQWRCHFIQKFEMEDRMEFAHLNRGYTDLGQELRLEWIAAWEEGKTGYPLVDAAMRCVRATGYLNFRLRAMVVSFLSHLLWQPWQSGVHHLARMFLDYEPGIHFCQFQMQAGVTGINTIRVYNPVKQAQEKDREGIFIRKWVPELAHIPPALLAQPSQMTAFEQNLYRCRLGEDYPYPVVVFEKAYKRASSHLHLMKKKEAVRQENQRILRRHVRPKAEE
ncbi:MAG: deoxyribodipyrimidine photo-lyase [Microscillaceae bacterium]